MRLQLTLNHQPNQALPINYQWLISSWIYRTLEKANPEFSAWLHENGFGYQGKQYKLFTFSALSPQRYRIGQRSRAFVLAAPPSTIELSFYVDEAMQHFIVGLFKGQQFSLKSGPFQADFEVSGIQMLAPPPFRERMRFRLLSPLCISRQEEGKKYADYLHPQDEGYSQLLIQNLLHKQGALQQQAVGTTAAAPPIDFPYDFQLLSPPKSKLFTIKGVSIRGYLFDFKLAALVELLELGYYAGFGEKNSGLGMGMVEVTGKIGR